MILSAHVSHPLNGSLADVRPGDILAWRGQGFWAWVVRTFTGSDFTHVGVIVQMEHEAPLLCLEANPKKGVSISLLADVLPAYHVATGACWGVYAALLARNLVGTKYSFLDGFLAWLHVSAVSPRFQCAELVRSVLNASFIVIPRAAQRPGEIIFHFIKSGKTLRYLS